MMDPLRLRVTRFLRRATDDSIRADVIGALFILGGLLGVVSMLFPHPDQGQPVIWTVSAIAALIGCLLIARAPGVNGPAIQGAVAFGSLLINVLMVASGVAEGVYAVMFCWVVLVSVNFFSARVAIAQFIWMMGGFAIVLTMVESGGGYSPFTRWITATLALAVTGGATGWLVYRRRLAERATQRFIDLSQEMLCTIGTNGQFCKLNPAWERSLGHSTSELDGTQVVHLIHPHERGELRDGLTALRGGADELVLENRCRGRDGTWHELVWNATFSEEEKLIYARVRPRRREPTRLDVEEVALERVAHS